MHARAHHRLGKNHAVRSPVTMIAEHCWSRTCCSVHGEVALDLERLVRSGHQLDVIDSTLYPAMRTQLRPSLDRAERTCSRTARVATIGKLSQQA